MLDALKKALRENKFLGAPYRKAALHWKLRQLDASMRYLPAAATAAKNEPEVLIFSRFGVETLGNYFILLGLLRALHKALPERRVFILSKNISYSNRGLAEIGALLSRREESADLKQYIAEKVSVSGEEKILSLAPGDLLMLGGGPILDDPALLTWLRLFEWARRAGARTMIAGCGIGPLRQPWAISLAQSLLANCDVALLRNTPADAVAQKAKIPIELVLDPAFLCHPYLAPLTGARKPVLAVNVRTLYYHEGRNAPISPATTVVENVLSHLFPLLREAGIQSIIPFSCWEQETIPDSALSMAVANALAGKLGIPAHPVPPDTVTGIVDALSNAEYLVSTRMHGFIIGLLLGCRSANLDYIEGGGKGSELYRQWLGRQSAPSAHSRGGLTEEDFMSLSSLPALRASIDGLCHQYASAILRACH